MWRLYLLLGKFLFNLVFFLVSGNVVRGRTVFATNTVRNTFLFIEALLFGEKSKLRI